MSQKGRKPKCTDQQLEVAAYTIYRNTGEWPSVEDFKSAYNCSFERARRAIDEAYTTVASASIGATHFEALAVYAGFPHLRAALSTILTLQKAPSNISEMKKNELRAAVMMRCPQEYSPYSTAEELRAILRKHGTSDDKLINKQKRDAEIEEQSPEGVEQFALRFSFQEYGSERMRRFDGILSSEESLMAVQAVRHEPFAVIPSMPWNRGADVWQWEGPNPRELVEGVMRGVFDRHYQPVSEHGKKRRS